MPCVAGTHCAKVLGTMREVGKVKPALESDSEPTEVRSPLLVYTLPPHTLLSSEGRHYLRFYLHSVCIHFQINDDVPNQIVEILQNVFYA